jgi:excisionase family DNA binding protein
VSADRLLTAAELAEMLGVETTWVMKRWQAGELPGFRLSYKVVRFRLADVEAWLEGRRGGPLVSDHRTLRAV